MSYEPTTWKDGDLVTSAKLNKLEQGVANGGGMMVVGTNPETGTLDKTWQEICDAAPNVILYMDLSESELIQKNVAYLAVIHHSAINYNIYWLVGDPFNNNIAIFNTVAQSPNDYPALAQDQNNNNNNNNNDSNNDYND